MMLMIVSPRPYRLLGRDRSFGTGTLRLLAPELHHEEYQGVRREAE